MADQQNGREDLRQTEILKSKKVEAVLGYMIPNSVHSYEQIAHANGLTYFDTGDQGWQSLLDRAPELARDVNEEFLRRQITEGKTFLLTADPYKAQQVFKQTKRGENFHYEMILLQSNGYQFEKYGEFWRAYK